MSTPSAAVQSVPDIVSQHASQIPHKTALYCDGETLSWLELDQRSNQVANGLIAAGCKVGDRVAILADNSVSYLEALVGGLKAACCMVPLPPMIADTAIAGMLEDSESSVLFISASCHQRLDNLKSLLGNTTLRHVIGLDMETEECIGLTHWREGQSSDAVNRVDDLDLAYNLIYSSGTTGVPKGIVHSHVIRAAYSGVVSGFGVGPDSVVVVSTGLYSNWTAMAMIISLYAGATLVVMRKFDAGEFLRLAVERGISEAFLVPAQIIRLLDDPHFEDIAGQQQLRVWCAGSPLAAERKLEMMERWPGGIIEIYGQTEGAPTTVIDLRAAPDKYRSVGKPMTGGEVVVIDDNGKLVAPGEMGELTGFSLLMTPGYHGRPEATELLKWTHPDGRIFYKSGDLGRIDEDGYVYVLDRKKDMILSGGLNVYAADLEQVLASHPDVQECTVIAVPSERWGESPLGLVIAKPGVKIDTEALLHWANDQLGKVQRLCAIEQVDAFPRGALDKILKRDLREQYQDSGLSNSR